MKFPAAFFRIAACVWCATFAALADEVDDFIRSAMQRQHIPGLSLAVVKRGDVTKSAAYVSIAIHHQNLHRHRHPDARGTGQNSRR
jgi:CubicO group peptidase (beta-lactamase class C family)